MRTSRQLAVFCAKQCEEKKADDIVVLDVRKLTFITDYFVVCSTRNERQSRAIVDELARILKAEGYRQFGVEGTSEGRWVLQDFGSVVVHVFREDQRAFYDIEGLWADAPRLAWKRTAKKTGTTDEA